MSRPSRFSKAVASFVAATDNSVDVVRSSCGPRPRNSGRRVTRLLPQPCNGLSCRGSRPLQVTPWRQSDELPAVCRSCWLRLKLFEARYRSALVQVSRGRLRILQREVPRVGTPLHSGWLSAQRRGSMDARQEANAIWVRLSGSRNDLATDWWATAALASQQRRGRQQNDVRVAETAVP